jgi:hypothetical protein
MPSTSTLMTGTVCWRPLRAVSVRVSAPAIPVIIAILLNTLTVNHDGFR